MALRMTDIGAKLLSCNECARSALVRTDVGVSAEVDLVAGVRPAALSRLLLPLGPGSGLMTTPPMAVTGRFPHHGQGPDHSLTAALSK